MQGVSGAALAVGGIGLHQASLSGQRDSLRAVFRA